MHSKIFCIIYGTVILITFVFLDNITAVGSDRSEWLDAIESKYPNGYKKWPKWSRDPAIQAIPDGLKEEIKALVYSKYPYKDDAEREAMIIGDLYKYKIISKKSEQKLAKIKKRYWA
ncbi:hypothetical protein Ddc_00213 [Ditylenchus destructor]|nr:hypothetical protein Ddc_00213 [Ditylenchus destructor]